MTMISFRTDEEQARQLRSWAEHLGVDRSELVRDALRRHLNALAAQREADCWTDDPEHDRAAADLASIADWGPAEDWSDWLDAEG